MDYFDHFLLNKPQGVIDESHVHLWSPTLATRDGIYTFSLSRAGIKSKLQARFSFVYHKENGVWKIAEHHSSAMPEQKLPTNKEVRNARLRIVQKCTFAPSQLLYESLGSSPGYGSMLADRSSRACVVNLLHSIASCGTFDQA
jgi:hypothetical protein